MHGRQLGVDASGKGVDLQKTSPTLMTARSA
jgi:hypothetical protein